MASIFDEERKKLGIKVGNSGSIFDEDRQRIFNGQPTKFEEMRTLSENALPKPYVKGKTKVVGAPKTSALSVSKKKENSLLNDILNPLKYTVQAMNPFDDVTLKEALVKNASEKTSKVGKELNRDAARTVDSATFGALGAATKAATGNNPRFLEKREGLGNNVADFGSTALGYLITGVGGATALKGTPLAANITKGMPAAQKALQLGKEGAVTGLAMSALETPAKEYINPELTMGDHLKRIGIETAIGGVADPLLVGAGSILKKLRRPITKTPYNVLSNQANKLNIDEIIGPEMKINRQSSGEIIQNPSKTLRLEAPQPEGQYNSFTGRFEPFRLAGDVQQQKANSDVLGLPEGKFTMPKGYNNKVEIKGTPLLDEPIGGGKPSEYWQAKQQELNDYISNNQLINDFNKAVDDQYQYLKTSMNNRKGIERGTTSNGMSGNFQEVTGRFNISNNPKWYQDFYAATGRKPTNAELKQLAREQVLKGFADETGDLPEWTPKAIDDINRQIDEINMFIKETGDQESYAPFIQELNAQKQTLSKQYDQLLKGTSSEKDVMNRAWEQVGDRKVKVDQLEELANPKPQVWEPLKFVRSKMIKKDPLNYVAGMNPKDMKATRVEGSYKTKPTNDGLKIETPEPLQFKKTVEAGKFKEKAWKERQKGEYTDFTEAKPKATEKDKLMEQIKQIREYMKTIKDDTQKAQYREQIKQIAQRIKKINEKEMLGLEKTLDEIINPSDAWKDKAKPLLKRETMDRNFEDIMGADAPEMKRIFLDPIKSSEAERVRFLNKMRNNIKSYGIKPKSKDDKLVQMYGEKKITLTQLKSMTDNWEKVAEVAENYRKTYDDLLTEVNAVLQSNGFQPIPRRKDYFPHYEEIDGLLHQFGFDMNDNTLPTDINGLSQNFKPSKNFFSNALRRKGDQTTFGAVEGFDRYIEGISNVIYHTRNIKKLRALEKTIRVKYEGEKQLSNFVAELQEYTNLLAGKKALFDRAFEDVFGRHIYNFMDTLRKRVGANMIGGNVSSALTNFIPVTQSMATTSKKAYAETMFDIVRNVFKNDGFINESDFLTKRVGSDPLVRTWWDKAVNKSMFMMKSLDNFASQLIVRSKYNELTSKGLTHNEAIKQADDWAARIMADRSKGGMPTLFNSKTLGSLSQFQLEVNNQLSFFFKDIPRNKTTLGMAAAYTQIALYGYLFNELYEKMTGRRPAFDVIGIAQKAYNDYNNDNITNLKATENLKTEILGTLPFTSAWNGGRFPIEAGIPNPNSILKGESTWEKEIQKPLYYLFPPAAGGQAKKALEGITTMGKNTLSPQELPGVYQENKDGEKYLKYPVKDSLANKIKAPIFGKSAFPETNEYYDNNRRPLSVNQTQELEKASDPFKFYNDLMINRRTTTIENKIKKIKKDGDLSDKEKEKQIQKLLDQLKVAKGGK